MITTTRGILFSNSNQEKKKERKIQNDNKFNKNEIQHSPFFFFKDGS